MKIFFDTEFTGLHKDTNLLSIGLISEDGRKFYGEIANYNPEEIDDWVQENVIDNFWVNNFGKFEWDFPDFYNYASKDKIAKRIKDFLSQFDSVELVSDVCHYDMVLLIDLFGTAFDLPKNISPTCHDINQDIANFHYISTAEAFHISREEILKNNNIKIDGAKHNALYDAKVIKAIYELMHKENL